MTGAPTKLKVRVVLPVPPGPVAVMVSVWEVEEPVAVPLMVQALLMLKPEGK